MLLFAIGLNALHLSSNKNLFPLFLLLILILMNGILMKLALKFVVLNTGFGLLLTLKLDLLLLSIFLKNALGHNALTTLYAASKLGKPHSVVSDRLPSYTLSTKHALPYSKHIKVQSFADDISNNLIESFNKTFKAWYKSKLGFKVSAPGFQLAGQTWSP